MEEVVVDDRGAAAVVHALAAEDPVVVAECHILWEECPVRAAAEAGWLVQEVVAE